MAFRIFASGTGGFHIQRRCPDEGDVFDAGSLPTTVGTLVTEGVGQELRNRASGQISPDNLQNALSTQGRISSVHLLKDAFRLTLGQSRRMNVMVRGTSESSLPFFPNNSTPRRDMNRMYFATQPNAANKFLHFVHKALEPAGLNRFGVLQEMARTFNEWGGSSSGGQTRIDFTITAL